MLERLSNAFETVGLVAVVAAVAVLASWPWALLVGGVFLVVVGVALGNVGTSIYGDADE